MITGAAYAGELKAYLSSPEFSPLFDTIQEIVESGIRIDYVVLGALEEGFLQTTDDPDYAKLWKNKNVLPLGGNKEVRVFFVGLVFPQFNRHTENRPLWSRFKLFVVQFNRNFKTREKKSSGIFPSPA